MDGLCFAFDVQRVPICFFCSMDEMEITDQTLRFGNRWAFYGEKRPSLLVGSAGNEEAKVFIRRH